jgi:hypothetical protein
MKLLLSLLFASMMMLATVLPVASLWYPDRPIRASRPYFEPNPNYEDLDYTRFDLTKRLPYNSPALRPTFKPFAAFNVDFVAHGVYYTNVTAGALTGLAGNNTWSLYVDTVNRGILIDLTASQYYMTLEGAWIYLPSAPAGYRCYKRINNPWTVLDEIAGYSLNSNTQIMQDMDGSLMFFYNSAPAWDIGAPGPNYLFQNFVTDVHGYPISWGFGQTTNFANIPGNVDFPMGGLYIDRSRTQRRRPTPAEMVLPAECLTTTLDVSIALGMPPGFPDVIQYPNAQAYKVPAPPSPPSGGW